MNETRPQSFRESATSKVGGEVGQALPQHQIYPPPTFLGGEEMNFVWNERWLRGCENIKAFCHDLGREADGRKKNSTRAGRVGHEGIVQDFGTCDQHRKLANISSSDGFDAGGKWWHAPGVLAYGKNLIQDSEHYEIEPNDGG